MWSPAPRPWVSLPRPWEVRPPSTLPAAEEVRAACLASVPGRPRPPFQPGAPPASSSEAWGPMWSQPPPPCDTRTAERAAADSSVAERALHGALAPAGRRGRASIAKAGAKAKARAKAKPKDVGGSATEQAAKPKAEAKVKAKAKAKAKAEAKAKVKATPASGPPPAAAATTSKRPRTVSTSGPAATKRRKLAGDGELEDNEELNQHNLDTTSLARVDELLSGSVVARDKAGFLARETGLQRAGVEGAARLFAEGCTLPFIARYRKEQTGGMGEDALRQLERALQRVDKLEKRRQCIAKALAALGKLENLSAPLTTATTMEELEELYAPFKTKRRTRGQMALEKGLAPLADLIERGGGGTSAQSPQDAAAGFVDEGRGVPTPKEALAGARDIVAERRSQDAEFKESLRAVLRRVAKLRAKRKSAEADIGEQYRSYYEFCCPIDRVRAHQFFAVQRGAAEKALSMKFECPEGCCDQLLWQRLPRAAPEPWLAELRCAVQDSLKRLLKPSIEKEWTRTLKERAEDESYDTYRRNLRAKLLAPPLFTEDGPHPGPIVGLDPGIRTGCKVAVVAATGEVLETAVLRMIGRGGSDATFPADSHASLAELLQRHQPSVISIGNGTASTETEAFVREVLKSTDSEVEYTVVDEGGASVYSASKLAGMELSGMDCSLRGAVSIARRLLDPLAELVKIDPQSLGVGLYQHDVDQKVLKEELRGAVEECVSAVGVDLNTASPTLLSHVAGLKAKICETLVEHRAKHGAFRSRQEIRKVQGLGAKGFQQVAGFLRVLRGTEPLDATAVHPESYPVARAMVERFGPRCHGLQTSKPEELSRAAAELGCGEDTVRDIAAQLCGTGEGDPRSSRPRPYLKSVHRVEDPGHGIDAKELGLTLQDLKPGMQLRGVVRNVVAFGAFVDIGVKSDGLLPTSHYPKPTPAGWPSVNDRVVVTVQRPPERRGDRWRISLTLGPVYPSPVVVAPPAFERLAGCKRAFGA